MNSLILAFVVMINGWGFGEVFNPVLKNTSIHQVSTEKKSEKTKTKNKKKAKKCGCKNCECSKEKAHVPQFGRPQFHKHQFAPPVPQFKKRNTYMLDYVDPVV